MLERIEIDGFRALAGVDVPVKPLTVLIGQNDSGKSSFLAALASFVMQQAPLPAFDHRGADEKHPVRVRATVKDRPPVERVSTVFSGNPVDVLQELFPLESYVLPSSGVPMESPGVGPGPIPFPGTDGHYVAAILDALLRSDRKRFDQIETVIRQHLPGVEALRIETPDPSRRRLDLVFQGGLKMPADNASTGARLMIFFITLAYHPTPPRLILLEEPENGVHPKRLAQIVALLREITEGKHGNHAAQIILTTHSPYLLDSIDPAVDQVIVFRRSENGDRVAEAVDQERLREFMDEFMLGEIWFDQGEEGLIKRKLG